MTLNDAPARLPVEQPQADSPVTERPVRYVGMVALQEQSPTVVTVQDTHEEARQVMLDHVCPAPKRYAPHQRWSEGVTELYDGGHMEEAWEGLVEGSASLCLALGYTVGISPIR